MVLLALAEQPSPEFEATVAAATGEALATKRCAEALAAASRAAAKALASRVDAPQEGLAKLSSMLVCAACRVLWLRWHCATSHVRRAHTLPFLCAPRSPGRARRWWRREARSACRGHVPG